MDTYHGRNVTEYEESSTTISCIQPNQPSSQMIITSWNISGLNSKGKKRNLVERLRKEKPELMLLQQTKILERKMDEIPNKIKSKYECMSIDVKGSAGGIAILWNPVEIIAGY